MTCITSKHNLLARITLMTLLAHKRVRKYHPTMCQKYRGGSEVVTRNNY